MSEQQFIYITPIGKMISATSAINAIELAKESGFIWLHYVEPTADVLDLLVEPLKLHPLSIEDVLDMNQIPKIDIFPDGSFIVFNALSYEANVLNVYEINFFIGKNFLISIDRLTIDGKPLLGNSADLIRREIDTCRLGPAFVMHTLIDKIVDDKFTASEAIEEELTSIEDTVLENTSQFDPKSLQQIRRTLVSLRKGLFHERELLVKISNKDCAFIPIEALYHYRNVYDHLTRLFELSETLRDITTSLMEINLSLRNNEMALSANRTNRAVRRLTVITTIFMPLTLIAGIGGMSEWTMMTGKENWRLSYPLFLLAMAIIGMVSYFFLRWFIKKSDDVDDDKKF